MRSKGKITSWNDEKGFGFVTPLAGGKRIFMHISAFGNRDRRPELNQVVTYAVSSDKQGRPCAVQATLAGDRLARGKKPSSGLLAVIGSAVFCVVIVIAVLASELPTIVLAFYLVASLLTYVAYAIDKSAARKGTWRTQERTLHLLSLLGGWPGALIAQKRLRHKSKKEPFRAVFWMTVLLNCGLLFWLLTPTGSATLRSLVDNVVRG